jgi:hypothetical protein
MSFDEGRGRDGDDIWMGALEMVMKSRDEVVNVEVFTLGSAPNIPSEGPQKMSAKRRITNSLSPLIVFII